MSELRLLVEDAGQRWKEHVIAMAAERFERRVGAEVGALRLDMAKEFGAVRVEIASGCADLRNCSSGRSCSGSVSLQP